MKAGIIVIEEEIFSSSGFVGGKIYARNTETGEEHQATWHRYHNGKNDRGQAMLKVAAQLKPVETKEDNDLEENITN